MDLTLFGIPAVALDEQPSAPLPPGRPTRLLAVLALNLGVAVDRDALVEAVWDSTPPLSLRNALHVYVSRLRAQIGSNAIQTSGTGYVLDLAADTIDIVRFRRHIDDAVAAARAGLSSRALTHYSAAIDTYSAPFLAGETLSAVLAEARHRFRDLHDSAREEQLAIRLYDASAADAATLIPQARDLVAQAPLRETRHALLMEALHRSGRTGDALEAYDSIAATLRSTLGIGPSDALRAVRDRILAPHSSVTPAAFVNEPLIGREIEVQTLTALVRERPLVTVTGAGGIGKSRVAREVVARLAPHFGGGVRVIDCSDLPHDDDAARSVHDLMSPADIPMSPTLLLIESGESPKFAELLPELLLERPRLRVLVTSRRPLGMVSEVVVPLSPLDLNGSEGHIDDLRDSAAVQFYLLKASEAGHSTSAIRADDVAELVRLFGVSPLAIELLASHPDGVRPDILRERPVVDLARINRPGPVERHRSMEHCLRWSLNHLSQGALTILHTVAECGSPIPESVITEARSGTDSAPSMSELIRWGVLERSSGSAASVTLPRWVREVVRANQTPRQRAASRTSIRRALAQCARTLLDLPLAVPLNAEASEQVFELQSLAIETQTWPEPWVDATDRAHTLLLLVDASLDRPTKTQFITWLDEIANESLPTDLNYDIARAQLGLALAASDADSVANIEARMSAALALVDDRRRAAWAIDEVFLSLERGEFEMADQLSERAAELVSNHSGDPLAIRAGRARMHAVHLNRGLRDGIGAALQTVALAEQFDCTESISAFGEAAEILISGGELELGGRFTRRAARQALRWNSPHSLVYVLSLADIAMAEGRLDESRAIVLALLDRVWRRGDDRYQKWCLIRLAQILERGGDPKRAALLLGASSTISVRAGWDADPDVCELLELLPAALGGEAYREAFDKGAMAPQGWVSAMLDEPISLPSTIDPELRAVLQSTSAPAGPF